MWESLFILRIKKFGALNACFTVVPSFPLNVEAWHVKPVPNELDSQPAGWERIYITGAHPTIWILCKMVLPTEMVSDLSDLTSPIIWVSSQHEILSRVFSWNLKRDKASNILYSESKAKMLTHVPEKNGLFADDLWGTSQTRIRDYMVVTQAASCYISPHNPHSYPKAWNITTRSPGKQDTSFSPCIQDLHLGFRRSAVHEKIPNLSVF